jgi:3-oxoacyl-[acyl-carrier-protein] synthase-1
MAKLGFIAPNANFSEPDEYSAHLNIATQRVDRAPEHVLCNSAGFGGTNSCLVLRFAG